MGCGLYMAGNIDDQPGVIADDCMTSTIVSEATSLVQREVPLDPTCRHLLNSQCLHLLDCDANSWLIRSISSMVIYIKILIYRQNTTQHSKREDKTTVYQILPTSCKIIHSPPFRISSVMIQFLTFTNLNIRETLEEVPVLLFIFDAGFDDHRSLCVCRLCFD